MVSAYPRVLDASRVRLPDLQCIGYAAFAFELPADELDNFPTLNWITCESIACVS